MPNVEVEAIFPEFNGGDILDANFLLDSRRSA